jgi:hypothetical protein
MEKTPLGKFRDWMRLMLRWSNNEAAGKCIRALGYSYINGLLAAAGFFDKSTKSGLWMSGDYTGHDWLPNDGAGQKLSPRWAQLQNRNVSNFTATALQIARFMTLLAQGRLVDGASSIDMVNMMTGVGGTSRFIAEALRDAIPPRNISSIASKIGVGNDNSGHDCAIISIERGGDPSKKVRYVMVALGDLHPENLYLKKLSVGFYDCIVSRHPLT